MRFIQVSSGGDEPSNRAIMLSFMDVCEDTCWTVFTLTLRTFVVKIQDRNTVVRSNATAGFFEMEFSGGVFGHQEMIAVRRQGSGKTGCEHIPGLEYNIYIQMLAIHTNAELANICAVSHNNNFGVLHTD